MPAVNLAAYISIRQLTGMDPGPMLAAYEQLNRKVLQEIQTSESEEPRGLLAAVEILPPRRALNPAS